MAWITLKPSGLGSVLCRLKCGAELPQADHHKPPYVCLPCTAYVVRDLLPAIHHTRVSSYYDVSAEHTIARSSAR